MKLPKAIEIGELNIKEVGRKMSPDTLDALKLLVEAGKREMEHRELDIDTRFGLLPGETEE